MHGAKKNLVDESLKSRFPVISVVITSYKRPVEALRAIRSALAQEFASFEVIVVEDGCRGELSKIAHGAFGASVTMLCHMHNLGLAAARNTGARIAQGQFIAFLDDDDLWDRSKLRQQIDLIRQHPSDAVVYCGSKTTNSAGKLTALNQPSFEGSIRDALTASKLTTVPSSLLMTTDLFSAVGGFDEDLATGIDHDFWFKLARFGISAWPVKKPLVIQSEDHTEQMTSNYPNRKIGVEHFLCKWRPYLEEWMAPGEASRFQKNYRAYFLGQSCITAMLKTGNPTFRFKMFIIFIRNPLIFLDHTRFLVAMLFGISFYRFLRKLKAQGSLRCDEEI